LFVVVIVVVEILDYDNDNDNDNDGKRARGLGIAALERHAPRLESLQEAEDPLIDVLVAGAVEHLGVEVPIGLGEDLNGVGPLALHHDLQKAPELGNGHDLDRVGGIREPLVPRGDQQLLEIMQLLGVAVRLLAAEAGLGVVLKQMSDLLQDGGKLG
jgi:hypothetical protein